MRKPWKLATTIATLPVLGACGGDGGPQDVDPQVDDVRAEVEDRLLVTHYSGTDPETGAATYRSDGGRRLDPETDEERIREIARERGLSVVETDGCFRCWWERPVGSIVSAQDLRPPRESTVSVLRSGAGIDIFVWSPSAGPIRE